MANAGKHTPGPWHEKASKIIAADCFAAYRAANPIGRKRYRPYSVPPQAQALVQCLAVNDERRAKAIFIHRAQWGATEYIGGEYVEN